MFENGELGVEYRGEEGLTTERKGEYKAEVRGEGGAVG